MPVERPVDFGCQVQASHPIQKEEGAKASPRKVLQCSTRSNQARKILEEKLGPSEKKRGGESKIKSKEEIPKQDTPASGPNVYTEKTLERKQKRSEKTIF